MALFELRDRYDYRRHAVIHDKHSSATARTQVVTRPAQSAAMVENTRNSSWQQNLSNAADAAEMLMLVWTQSM